MVYLIVGERNSGKTTRLLNIYKEKKGGGVASIKGNEDGYEIYKLVFLKSVGQDLLLASENPAYANKKGFFKFKRFYFSEYAFKKAELYITELISLFIFPLFLDEVGELELKGMGFHDICLKLINLQKDVYITVRDTNVSGFLKVFKPKEFRILEKE